MSMSGIKKINIGDRVKIIVDSQFDDSEERRIGQIGKVVEIKNGDEWRYKVAFATGYNWFKRHHFERRSDI